MKYTGLFILSLLLLACGQRQNNTDNEPIYKIGYTDLKVDGKMDDAVTNGRYVLALLEDKTVIVLDENMNRVKALEDNVNTVAGGKVEGINVYKKDFLLEGKDEVFVFDSNLVRKSDAEAALKKLGVVGVGVGTGDSSYCYAKSNISHWRYFDINNYNPILLPDEEILRRLKMQTLPFAKIYADSMYDIYACSEGEFGGRTFFANKHTNRVHAMKSYWGEVFKLNGIYYLIQHYTYGMTKQVKIHNPELLCQYVLSIPLEKGVCCNCASADSSCIDLSMERNKEWDAKHGLDNYYFSRDTATLSSFIKDNKLYSLCSTDSMFLYVDITDSFNVLQVIPKMDRRIGKYSSGVTKLTVGKNTILAIDHTYWAGNDATGKEEQITQVGFILLKGDSIKIYEHYSTKPYKIRRNE